MATSTTTHENHMLTQETPTTQAAGKPDRRSGAKTRDTGSAVGTERSAGRAGADAGRDGAHSGAVGTLQGSVPGKGAGDGVQESMGGDGRF